MRTLCLTLIALAVLAAPARAAVVNVRIEGQARTLFEGPIETTGRNVQSLSERATGAIRRCDGTNDSPGATIVPTGTAATADALAIQGQGFDGRWYDDYEDYLVNRLGDERSSWRLFKNNGSSDAFSIVGGCQMRLAGGQGVMWANQAGSPLRLTLSGSTVNTVAGAEVYVAGADGSQGSVLGSTDGSGNLIVSGLPAGWHRIKARRSDSVRSNRVDLCVNPCGDPPADMQVRTPPAPVFYGIGGTALSPGQSQTLARTVTPLRVSRAAADRSGNRRGLIAVSWRILEQGTGLLRWTIAADDLSTRDRTYVPRARGKRGKSAMVALPAGRVHALRFTATDRLQHDDASDAGRVLVPIDDRAGAVRRRGPWRKIRSSKAWKGTLSRGERGARLKVRLPAGRPALVLAGGDRATVRIGSRLVRVRGRKTVLGTARRKAGSVTITVVRGSIDLDGVAASP